MYLKSIEVHGFKSFAQKINFEFHNGITGIVGPNGSGKSNVGDAVRWVLGEQSAKQLRGGNMQDVIFSGTETRKPLSFASVAITLDNSDHKLPVDYNEVTVTRRLYRSGESEYLINGSSCRLKDIQEMFYDTGIGKEGYSIIGQGQIDKILSGKPEDRREMFDEAAGIVKFKRRKNTTIKKLEEEKRNLVRVTDILNELTKQLGPLEKQAETAKIYLSRRDELRNLDVNLFLLEYDHAGRLLQELEDKLGNAEQELKETTEEFDRTKTEYDRLEKELEELNRHLDDLKEKQQENALQKQQYESRIKILEEQISAGKQNTEHYESRMNVLKGDLEKRNQEKEKLSGERTELRAQKKEIQKTLDEGQKQMEKILSNVEDCTRAVEDGKNEIIELLNSRATTKGKAQRFDAMMEQLEIRKAEISKKVLVLKTEEETLSGEKTKAEHTYKSVSSSIRSMNEECVRLDGEVRELQEKIKEQNKQMETGQAAYHREASRLESLKNITERYEGYGNSIRRVMEQKRREPGIRGVVADIIQVQKNYELAIETALGGSIQNIVTDNEQTAKRMIDFLKKNRYGRATFLPLSNISGKGGIQKEEVFREPGVIGAADTLVRAALEPVGGVGGEGILLTGFQHNLVEHRVAVLPGLRHLGTDGGSRLSCHIQVHLAPAAAEGLLLAGVVPEGHMGVLGAGLPGKQHHLLGAAPLGVHIGHQIQAYIPPVPQTEVRHLKMFHFFLRQHNPRLLKIGKGLLPGFQILLLRHGYVPPSKSEIHTGTKNHVAVGAGLPCPHHRPNLRQQRLEFLVGNLFHGHSLQKGPGFFVMGGANLLHFQGNGSPFHHQLAANGLERL